MRVTFEPLVAGNYKLFALFDPALANSSRHDTATRDGDALLGQDGAVASALVAAPGFTRTSNGFVGTSDGWTDLASDKTLDFNYDTAPDGNVLQTGEIALDGTTTFTLALGFGGSTVGRRVGGAREPRRRFRGAVGGLRRRVARLPGRRSPLRPRRSPAGC